VLKVHRRHILRGAERKRWNFWNVFALNSVKAIPLQTWTAQRVPGVLDAQISRQSSHEGKVVSPKHRPPLPTRKYSWYPFLLEAESIPEL